MKEKKNKKKLGIIVLSAVLIILAIDVMIFGKKDSSKEHAEQTKDEHVVKTDKEKKKVTKENKVDPLKVTKSKIQNIYRDKITAMGEGEEYSDKKTAVLKREIMQMAQKGEFGDIATMGEKLTSENKFSKGENLDIAGYLYDVSLLLNVYEEENKEIYGKEVAKSKTPDFLLTNTMFSDNFARRMIIEDDESLAPIGFEDFEIKEKRVISDKKDAEKEEDFGQKNIADDIFTLYDDTVEIFAYDMKIEKLSNGLPLTAYIREDLNGNLKFYGMYAPDDFKTYEQTMAWWKDQDVHYEDAEREQEKNYEENAKNGVITEEQIDKFFDSGY